MLISSSYYESFGMTMLEAFSLKTTVLTTDTTGGRFLTDDGKYGMLVANTDEAILEGMRTCLNHKELLIQYSEQAYQREKIFDKSMFDKKLLSYLGSL